MSINCMLTKTIAASDIIINAVKPRMFDIFPFTLSPIIFLLFEI